MLKNLDFNYIYKDRKEAYSELFKLLPKKDYDKDWKIITTTIDNLPYIDELSNSLNIDYEPFFISEIKAPKNEECTIASLSELKDIVIEKNLVRSFEIDEDFIYQKAKEIFQTVIQTKLYAFKDGKSIKDLEGKKVLIFSDGCDIGLNLHCTVKSLINSGVRKIFLFLPIISEDLYHSLDMIVDEVFVNHKIKDFIRTSYYFENFEELDLDIVRYILENKRRKVESKSS